MRAGHAPPLRMFHLSPEYQPLMREMGLDADGVFSHPDIRVWRSIPERENCVLDHTPPDGEPVKLHIKRYRSGHSAADEEAAGIQLLQRHGIPTVPLVGWGHDAAGRGFVLTEDLAGYRAADKLIADGVVTFEQLLAPTADLAARLHGAGLHHRDLYLCHFFARPSGQGIDLKLIDAARVRPLPRRCMRQRWIVKDLGQFWYSMTGSGVPEPKRVEWLSRYAQQRGVSVERLRSAVERKSNWIGRHDERLRRKQPRRNISLPGA
jgi:hypothetical protein